MVKGAGGVVCVEDGRVVEEGVVCVWWEGLLGEERRREERCRRRCKRECKSK